MVLCARQTGRQILVFSITTAKEYREKVEADVVLLQSAIDNSSYAINAVTSTYHLHEWLWAHVLKSKCPTQVNGTAITKKADFVSWLDANCPYFGLIQLLTNGSKHAFPVSSGGRIAGYGAGPYGIGPYDMPYLLIDLGENSGRGRYLVASDVIDDAAEFMIKLAKSLGA